MIEYIGFSVFITFFSWIFGMLLYLPIRNTSFHDRALCNLNFIQSEELQNRIGLEAFKWVVKNTFFKLFNPKLNLQRNSRNQEHDLKHLRVEMVSAELSHLIAFILICIVSVLVGLIQSIWFGFTLLVVNILMNLYPVLLQQRNKRRIDRFLNK